MASILKVSELHKQFRIVLLGKTGSGKSSTGNTILGKECFKHAISAKSTTETCETHQQNVSGKDISVTDTPGLFDTSLTEEKLKHEIENCVYMSVPGPHVFLLVVRLNVKFTEEEKNTVSWIQKNFGEKAARYTIILFTYADALDGKSLVEYIKESPDLQSLTDSCGGRYHSFNNKNTENCSQVTELLEKIEKLVEENEGKHYTNGMYEEAQKKIKNRAKFWSETARIVLLGKTGSKSTIGNIILGRDVFTETRLTKATCTEAIIDGKSISIMDTPQLYSLMTKEQNQTFIEDIVLMSAPGPHVFLPVIRLERFPEEENTVRWIQKNIGEDAARWTIILFTHADALDGKSLVEYIKESPDLQALTDSCGGRYHSFSVERENRQVTQLLEKIEQMVESNEWMCYSNKQFEQIINRHKRQERFKKLTSKVIPAAIKLAVLLNVLWIGKQRFARAFMSFMS